jgi:maleylpyruvate isomerase
MDEGAAVAVSTLVEQAREDSARALDALIEAVRALPDDAGTAPSPLPDWTRGHVLAHVVGAGDALARQAEYAARGELVEPYTGGAAGRNAEIEAGAGRTVPQHVDELERVRDRLDAAWPEPGSPLWDAPVAYRSGTVTDALLAWWREVRIHAVDAEVDIGYESWDEALRGHLREFLAVRLPDGGAGIELRGDDHDVVAWLAGREPSGPVEAWRDGAAVPLPELGGWPSAANR